MTEYERALQEHLQQFLTPERQAKFTATLSNRTRQITVVLVDLYQEHNASAILRSCEAFGVQDVYVVESTHKFSTKRDIAMGTDRWLTLHRFEGENSLDRCFAELKDRNFRTAATVVNEKSLPVSSIEFQQEKPLALFFGTEKEGLPPEVIERVDICTHIPMFGFVESFNVSVAAALSLHILTEKLKQSGIEWELRPNELEDLYLEWTRKSVSNCAAIEKRFKRELEASS